MASQPTSQQIEAVFNHYDGDNSGYLTQDQLMRLIKVMKPSQNSYNTVKIMKNFDKDADEKVFQTSAVIYGSLCQCR